ncbi:hypothetical protein CAPTEDRAFT_202279 [Capitella teleta]|uniref:Uncharacterized protein n=1 Tax=Capitella teleta TaxID=283909 RepID=R7TA93_CAPTE|nr:hypothetical protein CAPTEDRAFT_202279 [Capitella teleta]|eukprot:ELT90402.1 hypothetical protein CAPTEDRAFT_202279 [Capitella teleta]
MPQCKWKSLDLLFGKGSMYTNMLDTAYKARVRATIINEGERSRLRLYHKTLEKHQRVEDARRSRVLDKLRRRVQEMDAYQEVLQDNFKVDQFHCLQFGFKQRRDAMSPTSFRRWQLENRILNCGFSKETLKPEVQKILDASKPDKQREARRARLLKEARGRSDFVIDRKGTNNAKRLLWNILNKFLRLHGEEKQSEFKNCKNARRELPTGRKDMPGCGIKPGRPPLEQRVMPQHLRNGTAAGGAKRSGRQEEPLCKIPREREKHSTIPRELTPAERSFKGGRP